MSANVSKVILCGRCETSASLPEDWVALAWQVQHFSRVALRVFANTIVRAASSGDNVQKPWQA